MADLALEPVDARKPSQLVDISEICDLAVHEPEPSVRP